MVEVGGDLETDEFRNGYVAFKDFVCKENVKKGCSVFILLACKLGEYLPSWGRSGVGRH